MFELHSEYVGFTRIKSLVRLVYGREVQLQSVVTGALYVHTAKEKIYLYISSGSSGWVRGGEKNGIHVAAFDGYFFTVRKVVAAR